MNGKKLFWGGLIGAAFALAAGCASTSNSTENKNIMIGGLAPLTGDGASYGVEFQRIAELSLANVNEAWAEEGMTLDIQWEDGGCNGKDAATAAQKLVGVDKVEVILGGFCSSETLAAAPITEAAGVILFSPGSSSPDVTNAGNYVFRNWPSDAFQGQKLAELANELGYKKVAMITEQQDYTFGISKVFKEKFGALGGTTVEEVYLSEDTDFKTQLTKLSGEGADVFFVNPQTPNKSEVILKQMQELGVKGPFLLNDVTGTSTEILSAFSEYLEGAHTATPYLDQDSETFKALQADYKAAHATDFQYLGYGAAIYDAVQILAMALADAGNDADLLQGYLSAFPGYTGLMGETNFDANGDPTSGHSIFKITGGALTLQ